MYHKHRKNRSLLVKKGRAKICMNERKPKTSTCGEKLRVLLEHV